MQGIPNVEYGCNAPAIGSLDILNGLVLLTTFFQIVVVLEEYHKRIGVFRETL